MDMDWWKRWIKSEKDWRRKDEKREFWRERKRDKKMKEGREDGEYGKNRERDYGKWRRGDKLKGMDIYKYKWS